MISKKHFIFLYSFIKKIAFALENIKVGFAINSLFLFNLDRVLRSVLAPLAKLAKLANLKVNKVKVEFY